MFKTLDVSTKAPTENVLSFVPLMGPWVQFLHLAFLPSSDGLKGIQVAPLSTSGWNWGAHSNINLSLLFFRIIRTTRTETGIWCRERDGIFRP